MECVMGVRGRNFVVVATDSVSGRSIMMMKKDQDKTFQLSDRLLMAVCGDQGDAVQFAEYIAKNVQLYRMRNGYDLSVNGAVSFTRKHLADSLRTSSAYMVNLLIGGYDDEDKASLYYMDYLGSKVSVPYAIHGYGAMFSLSVMDRHYRPDLTEAEAVELLQKCVNEVNSRMVVQCGDYKVKVIDSDGIRHLADISPQRDLAKQMRVVNQRVEPQAMLVE